MDKALTPSSARIPSVLWKEHRDFGVVFFCPGCLVQLCNSTEKECSYCEAPIDWNNKIHAPSKPVRWG